MILSILKQSIVKRILSGTFWTLIGTAVAKFLILLAGIECARILGATNYGKLGIIRSTIAMFIVIGSSGLGMTASKYIAEFRADNDTTKITSIYWLTNGFSLIIGLFVTLIILLFAPIIANNSLYAPELTNDIRIGSILLFFSIVNASQNGVLAGFENFRAIGINTLISGFFEASLIIIGAYYYKVSGAIVGYGISFILLTWLNFHSIKKTFKQHCISRSISFFKKSDVSVLWKFSIPAALNSIMVTPVFWCIRTMLVRFNGFEQLGIYEAADQWKVIILFLPSALGSIILPIISNLNGNEDSKNYKRVIKLNLFSNVIITASAAILISLSSSLIMKSYGNGFDNTSVLIILSVSTIFTSSALVITISLISKGKVWISFLFQVVWAFCMIAFSYLFLLNNCGALSLGYAICISYFILFVIQFIYSYYE